MSIGDWIREANERRQQKRSDRLLRQGYDMGYADAQQGKPPRPPGAADKNGPNASDSNDSNRGGE